MALEIKYISSGKIPFEVKAPTKTTRSFMIKEMDITTDQANTICEYINKDSNTKLKCTYEILTDPVTTNKVYYFTFHVFKSRVGLETPLYNAIAIYLDNQSNTATSAAKAPNTLKRGQTFKSAAQMQQSVGPPTSVVNSFTLPITGTIINIKGKKPNYDYDFTLPYWDEDLSNKLFYGLNGLTNFTRLWSRQVLSNDSVKFTFEEKANTTSADLAQDYKVIDELIRQYLEEYLAQKNAPVTQVQNANLSGVKLAEPYYLMPKTEVQVYKEDLYNIPLFSFYLTGGQNILNIVNQITSYIITDTAFGLGARSTLIKSNPDLYKIAFEVVSDTLDDQESTFNYIDQKLNKLDYKNAFTSTEPTKALVQTQADLLDIENKVEKLKTELDQLVFLRSLNSQLDFEKNIELGQKITNVKEKINELNFDKLQANITTDDIFDQLFEQSFTPIEHEYTNVKIPKGENDDFFTPNGQPSELSEQLNEIIRTEQFKQWFGDWQLTYMYKQAGDTDTDCSVVLTENFEPKLFYHGTGQAFSYFKFDKFPAAYFAANQAYSQWFANMHGGDEGYTIPFFLNVRNPLDLTLFGTEKIKPKEFFDYMYLQTGFDADQLEANPLLTNPSLPPVECWVYLRNNPKMLKKLAENEVYDGIHFYETNPGVSEGLPAYRTEVFITFKADQCKIADNNRGLILLGALKSFLLEKGGKI
jgi:hypothetical protein